MAHTIVDVIERYPTEAGVEVHIILGPTGRCLVALFDIDAADYLPTRRSYGTREYARAYALHLVACLAAGSPRP